VQRAIVAPDHTQYHEYSIGKTPLYEGSACRRDFYLTTHNIQDGLASMATVGFEPGIHGGEQAQTYAVDIAATGIGLLHYMTLTIQFR